MDDARALVSVHPVQAGACDPDLGRKEEAGRLLDAEEPLLKDRADRDRLRRIKEMRGGRKTVLDAPAYERLADRALREGHRDLALEHYRAARILREAAPQTA